HGADDAIVAQDEPLVDASGGIAQHDLLAVVTLGEIASGIEVDAGDLEAGGGGDGSKAGSIVTAEARGEDIRHIVERGDEAEALPLELDAFAQRVDGRI